MNFRTISDLNNLVCKNIHKIPDDVDLIVGIPRSGLMVASMIALYLNLPLTDLESLVEGRCLSCGTTKIKTDWIQGVNEARKILVVEDSSSTGKSLKEAREKLKQFRYQDRVIFLTAYVTNETKKYTDLFFDVLEAPRMFEWNYLHHSRLDNMCFDIDGVLCTDPTEEENDDGEKYKYFIRNAPVRVVPTFKIGYLITSRLEKYREDTEYWLHKNGIQYDNLIMMQFTTKEERIESGSHGIFKGKNYKKLKGTYMFIESDPKQAEEIARLSGKTVFCTGNQKVYKESSSVRIKGNIKKKLKKILPIKIKLFLKKILK